MKRISLKICLVIVALFGSVSIGTAENHLPSCSGSPEVFKSGSKPAYKTWNNCIGTVLYASGSFYTGGFENGRWSGQGTHLDRYHSVWISEYTGNWAEGRKDGYGVKKLALGDNKGSVIWAGIWRGDKLLYGAKNPSLPSLLKTNYKKLSLQDRKAIQANLKDLGLYKPFIDGLYGNRTAVALSGYNAKYLSKLDLSVTKNVTKLLEKVLASATGPKPITDKEAELFIKIKEDFGLNYYGGFIHSERLPNTLFFFSDIKKNDSFEFRKALRVHDIELVVLSSPGGSVFEGLQTAGIIHDKKLKTYIPKKSLYGSGDCASACSFMFFAGASRSAEGDLGVHQFYSGKASDEAEIGSTQKTAQFTVSEIIGFLNEFETPPWVFERMFQQKEMYYFKESELLQLETEVSEETTAQHEKADKFISDFRSAFVKIKD